MDNRAIRGVVIDLLVEPSQPLSYELQGETRLLQGAVETGVSNNFHLTIPSPCLGLIIWHCKLISREQTSVDGWPNETQVNFTQSELNYVSLW